MNRSTFFKYLVALAVVGPLTAATASFSPAWIRPAWIRPAWIRPAWIRPAWIRPAWIRPAWIRPAWIRPAWICTIDDTKPPRRVMKSEAEWKKILTPEEFAVARQHGTERAFTSPLAKNHDHGEYRCICCHEPLFRSETKFESGTGWPSFYAPISKNVVKDIKDTSYGMVRTEVQCAVCDAHLGHVFNDGPEPTGLRYCMNGVALEFVKK